LAGLAALSPSATNQALRRLAEHGLAERGPHGWHRGPIDPDVLADALGIPDQTQAWRRRWPWRPIPLADPLPRAGTAVNCNPNCNPCGLMACMDVHLPNLGPLKRAGARARRRGRERAGGRWRRP
jgi:hypothetical protein